MHCAAQTVQRGRGGDGGVAGRGEGGEGGCVYYAENARFKPEESIFKFKATVLQVHIIEFSIMEPAAIKWRARGGCAGGVGVGWVWGGRGGAERHCSSGGGRGSGKARGKSIGNN